MGLQLAAWTASRAAICSSFSCSVADSQFSSTWSDRLRARDREHHGRAVQQPGQGHLGRGRPGLGDDRRPWPVRPRQRTRRHREPRDEPDALGLAVVQQVVRGLVGQVVQVLHGDHRHDPAGLLQLVDTHLGEADVPYLAFGTRSARSAELLVGRHLRRRSGGAGRGRCARGPRRRRLSSHCWRRYSGRPTGSPHPGALAGEPGLGGDDQTIGVGVEGLEDEPLADLGTVGVGRVDEIDPHARRPGAGRRCSSSRSAGSSQTPGPVICMAP